MKLYLEALRESGHSENNHEVFVMYPAYVGESDGDARADAFEPWHRWRAFVLQELGIDPSKGSLYDERLSHFSYDTMVAQNRAIFGEPETCMRHLQRIREIVGTTHIGLTFHFGDLSQEKILKSMERFARYVMPALK